MDEIRMLDLFKPWLFWRVTRGWPARRRAKAAYPSACLFAAVVLIVAALVAALTGSMAIFSAALLIIAVVTIQSPISAIFFADEVRDAAAKICGLRATSIHDWSER